MANLLATLYPVLADHHDSSDATYTADQSGTLATPPSPASEASTAIGGGDLDNSADLGTIEYLIFFARCNLINPVVGDAGTFANPRVQWAQGVSSLDDAGVSFTENAWGWVDSGHQLLAPDGGAWTWAKVNDLHDISPVGTFFQDLEPASTVMEIRCSEAYAEVWGTPTPLAAAPRSFGWLWRVLDSWIPAPPLPWLQRKLVPVMPAVSTPPFGRRDWLSRVVGQWNPPAPDAPRRRRQQVEAFPVSPPPAQEEACYPRLDAGPAVFTRLALGSPGYARASISGAYTREGAASFGGSRLSEPATPFGRTPEPECVIIGYGDDYGVNYGGN